MRARRTHKSNKVFILPGGTVAVDAKDNPVIASVWVPSAAERRRIAAGENIELLVWGTGTPPVAVTLTNVPLGKKPGVRFHRHTWEPHPAFEALNRRGVIVRRCTRCMRVEDRAFLARRWGARRHLQPPRDRLRGLRPFGLFWEINTTRPSVWSKCRAEQERAGAWWLA